MSEPKIDAFTRAYIECALWSSTAYDGPEHREADPDNRGTFDSSFESCGYGIDDLTPKLLAECIEECRAFRDEDGVQHAIDQACADHGYSDERAGHDFWLTRNGHGAGFWDRGLGDIGAVLTTSAHAWGEANWYVTEDGKIGQM